MRVEVGASVVGARVDHVAACPEVAPELCATEPLPDHRHALDLLWTRADLGVTVGLGRRLGLGLSLPFDLRRVEVTYSTLDGAPYDPPYDDIHHRDEWLIGPSDGRLTLQHSDRLGDVLLGETIGATLPLGETVEDPFLAGEEGRAHEHQQLGAGLPLLVVGASAVWPGRWGALLNVGGQLPVATNRSGFRAPMLGGAEAGPSFTPSPRLGLRAGLGLLIEGPEHWHEEPYGGRSVLRAGAAGGWSFSPRLRGELELRVPLWQQMTEHEHGDDEGGSFRELPLLRLGLSFTGAPPEP